MRLMLQGTLNWMHVPTDTLMKNITVPGEKIYQFAISANTKTERSGMVWADCTIIHNKSEYLKIEIKICKNTCWLKGFVNCCVLCCLKGSCC